MRGTPRTLVTKFSSPSKAEKNYAIHLITLDQSKYTRNRQKSGLPVYSPFDTLLPAHSPFTHRHANPPRNVHSKPQQHSLIKPLLVRFNQTSYLAQTFDTTIQTRTRNGTTCNDTATQEHTPTHTHQYSRLLLTTQTLSYQGYTWMQQRHI